MTFTFHNSSINELSRDVWDAIVIGAGPSGSLAAQQIAKAGLRVILVDAKAFPREKVCGGYLNCRALDVLKHAEILHVANHGYDSVVHELELVTSRQRVRFPLPAGRVVRRTDFDAALVDEAAEAGALVITGIQAQVAPKNDPAARSVTLVANGQRYTVATRAIVCADGLSRSSIRHLPEFASLSSVDSRIGIGAAICDSQIMHPAGRVTMVVARQAYVGISRIDASHLNVAAAVDPSLLARATPAEIINTVLTNVGVSVPVGLDAATWRGTPPLTSRPTRVSSERVLLIGDASGYVEPFTGEGMAAALEMAVAVVPFVELANRSWVPTISTCWNSLHRQIVRDRQHTCRKLSWILRRPWATYATLSACRAWPGLATRWISKTSLPTSSSGAAEH